MNFLQRLEDLHPSFWIYNGGPVTHASHDKSFFEFKTTCASFFSVLFIIILLRSEVCGVIQIGSMKRNENAWMHLYFVCSITQCVISTNFKFTKPTYFYGFDTLYSINHLRVHLILEIWCWYVHVKLQIS